MPEKAVSRRLAALMAGDIAGYSRLMAADETGTFGQVKTVMEELIAPLVSQHGGRLIRTMGDGFLAEFPSAHNCVASALDIQGAMLRRNQDIGAQHRLDFRIGINFGDVIADGDDVYGEGVNIAARLESLAEPSQIVVSQKVRDEVIGKIIAEFHDFGEKKLKNIPQPVRIFGVAPASAVPPVAKPGVRLGVGDRPAIAVLPFANMSGDPEQEYFADGIAEDLITALSNFRWLLVIARNSSFVYKGRNVDIKQVALDLGVRYVLEGSVRKGGNRLRITGQLIDADTAAHLWADKYDGGLQDVFDLQDKVTRSVAAAIGPRLLDAEITRAMRKSTSNLDAYDYCLRARPHALGLTREGLDQAIDLLRSATKLDSTYAQAWGMLALCTANRYFLGHLDFDAVASEALRFARRAVDCDRDDPEVLAVAAYMLAWGGKHEDATELADRAVRLNPYSSYVCKYVGWTRVFTGSFEDAISLFRTTLILDPISPHDASAFVGIAAANFYLKQYDEAAAWARRANAKNPEITSSFRYLAAALAHAGDFAEARKVVKDLLARQPNSSLTRSRSGSAFRHGWMVDHYLEGLRLAGLPE